jgi:hypothetical protein
MGAYVVKDQDRQAARNICSLLRRHKGQRTVLGVAIPVLLGHIQALAQERVFDGLTESEIVEGFRELAGRFVKSDYVEFTQ